MPARASNRSAHCFVLLAYLSFLTFSFIAHDVSAQPVAHHAGAWTTAEMWPGKTTWSSSVWAVHMGLVRGDTLFARPHSQVAAWGQWDAENLDGGIWGWNPKTDVAADARQNLTLLPVARPEFNPFCAGAAALPNGDFLIVSGTERSIAGELKSARYHHQDQTWVTSTMNARRWYANATVLPTGHVLATSGLKYDHMIVFGGRRESDGRVVNDLQRYAITNDGEWDPPLTGSGPTWPERREGHTLADQALATQDGWPYYLFGGKDSAGVRNDVWQLKLSIDEAQSYVWAELALPEAGRPAKRWRHVAVVDRTGDRLQSPMYLHGGEDATGTARGDLWKLEWVTSPSPQWKWTQITNATGAPSARSGHTAVWDQYNDRLLLFGGTEAGGGITDTNLYVLRFPASGPPTWTIAPRTPNNLGPAARTLHAMAANAAKSKLAATDGWFHGVVFGGQRADSLSNELWELFVHPITDEVRWVLRRPNYAPAPRTRASVILYEDYPVSAVVLGGELAGGGWDTHVWEMKFFPSPVWEEQEALGQGLRGSAAFREQRPVTAVQPERFNPDSNTWMPFGGPKYRPSYHMLFLASDGKLYSPGPNYFDTDSTFRFDPVARTWSLFVTNDGANALDNTGTGVLYRPNKIMKCGEGTIDPTTGEYRKASVSLTVDEATPQWRQPLVAMGLSRADHTVNMLPTGEVIATGGRGLPDNGDSLTSNDAPRNRPEIWDPTDPQGEGGVGYWYGAEGGDTLNAEPVTRAHHSSAVILPDGRILSGGGWDPHPLTVRKSVDQYSPPYLFKPISEGGGAAVRPQLLGAQEHITWNQDFRVACPETVLEACLIRPGATTHAFNQDNRYVPLTKVSQSGHEVLLRIDGDRNFAPPGNYLLFVLRNDGGRKVPSIARWVNVGDAATIHATWDIVPPAAINDLVVTGYTSTSHTLQWTAPASDVGGTMGQVARYEIRYRSDGQMPTLEDFFTHGVSVAAPVPLSAGQVQTFTVNHPPAGQVLYFRIISRDAAGHDRNWSGLSNEAQTPNGGSGGCPFVDTRTAAGWEVENSILGRSLTGALSLDSYRLKHPPEVSGGRVRLRVRENEQERTTLDQLRLISVDHAPGMRAFAMGEELVIGAPSAAARVTTSARVDVTSLMNGTGGGFPGGPGDTLMVEFAAHEHVLAGGEERSTTSHNPFHIDDGGKCPPDCGYPLRSPDRLTASEIDAEVLRSSGIELQVPDGLGGWRTMVTRYPREHPDEAVLEGLGHGPVRMVFVGRHRVRFVGRLEEAGGEFTARKLPLLAARHTRFGDVAAAMDTTGNLTSELAPGDTVSLEFAWAPIPEGQVREYFLLSHGVYTANLPAALQEALPARFAIRVPRPNPFAASTMLRFELPAERHVRLEVLDAQGRRVRTLANHMLPAGSHAIEWDGRNEASGRVGPGVYFYKFEAGDWRANGRVTLVP